MHVDLVTWCPDNLASWKLIFMILYINFLVAHSPHGVYRANDKIPLETLVGLRVGMDECDEMHYTVLYFSAVGTVFSIIPVWLHVTC